MVKAGLSAKEFSGKKFRPTGPTFVRNVGRWKNQEIMYMVKDTLNTRTLSFVRNKNALYLVVLSSKAIV